VRGEAKLNCTLGESPHPPPLRYGGTTSAKFSFAFLICARPIFFFPKGKGNFASVFRPQGFGRARRFQTFKNHFEFSTQK